ncbi:MAG TPA: hypothetical protein VIX19_18800 [Terriglobales bacterium]
MRSRFSVSTVSCLFVLAVLVIVPRVSAQPRLDVFVTPIPNAPFSGTINVERSMVMKDGTIADFKTTRNIHRDSRGRIYTEARNLLPAASNETPEITRILLYDPQTRISTTLFPQNRTFTSGTVNRPPETVPPAFLNASPTGNALPQNEYTREEDLGIHDMGGVAVHGVRETQTISGQSSGTGKDVVITDEYWYSADLRLNMVIKHNDPRTGAVTMTVTHVTRSEPDPTLLDIPEGYTPAGASSDAKQ